MKSLSRLTSAFCCWALAMALSSSLLTIGAAALRVKRSSSTASPTRLPRTMSRIMRTLRGLILANLRLALACIAFSLTLAGRGVHGRPGRLAVGRVATEGAGRSELAQLVTDHVLADEHGHELV